MARWGAPAPAPPVLAAPVLAAPVLAAPVLAAPVLAAPVLAAPVLAAPVPTAPVLAAAPINRVIWGQLCDGLLYIVLQLPTQVRRRHPHLAAHRTVGMSLGLVSKGWISALSGQLRLIRNRPLILKRTRHVVHRCALLKSTTLLVAWPTTEVISHFTSACPKVLNHSAHRRSQ